MAFFTFALSWVGSIARLGTVLVESDDFMFRLQYITGTILNTFIIIQFGLYWNSSKAPPKKVDTKNVKKNNKNKVE